MSEQKPSSNRPSRFGIWIPVTDAARARDFYSTVFGWRCMDTSGCSPMEGIKETFYFTNGGAINGCFCVVEEEHMARAANASEKLRVGVHAVFEVADIEESLDLIEKHGGQKHVGKSSMGPNKGFVARFTDTEGNLMGIYTM